MKKHAIKIVPNQINYYLSVHYILPFVGIKEKCHAPYREVLRDEEHCVTNQIKLFYAETNMALLMLELEEYSQQVVKHKNYHTVPENIHYHPQLLGGMPKTLNKCLKLKWDIQMGGGRKNALLGRGMDIFWNYILQHGLL